MVSVRLLTNGHFQNEDVRFSFGLIFSGKIRSKNTGSIYEKEAA